MKPAFHTGASGLIAQQQAMNTIGNNMANVNTVGYQPKDVSFASLLNTQMYVNTPEEPTTGHGVRAVDVGLTIGAGALKQSGNPLDFAILGDGFFAVESNEMTEYTRDGTFHVIVEGDSGYLGTIDDKYVLDQQGNRISLNTIEDETNFDLTTLAEDIGIYQFANPSALSATSSNRYVPTDKSGQAQEGDGETTKLMQGALEGSGVSLTDEMTKLISVQRAFQLSARVVQVSDEIEQTANSLRK